MTDADTNCFTLPNGDCVGGLRGGQERCMHDPPRSALVKHRLCHDSHPLTGLGARCPGNICLPAESPAYRMVQVRADDLSVLLNIVARARARGLIGASDQPALEAYVRADRVLQNTQSEGQS